ncbi:MAG: hypothetical protein BWY75_00368 [bacterium ADurb.Bin425]|nr:MAG: hypothetical protein BWY75_00368 [bacterium ADurb.Bin425]
MSMVFFHSGLVKVMKLFTVKNTRPGNQGTIAAIDCRSLIEMLVEISSRRKIIGIPSTNFIEAVIHAKFDKESAIRISMTFGLINPG